MLHNNHYHNAYNIGDEERFNGMNEFIEKYERFAKLTGKNGIILLWRYSPRTARTYKNVERGIYVSLVLLENLKRVLRYSVDRQNKEVIKIKGNSDELTFLLDSEATSHVMDFDDFSNIFDNYISNGGINNDGVFGELFVKKYVLEQRNPTLSKSNHKNGSDTFTNYLSGVKKHYEIKSVVGHDKKGNIIATEATLERLENLK